MMNDDSSTTARQFFLRMAVLSAVTSGASVAVISVYLASLLRLPNEQWFGFFQTVLGMFVLLFAASTLVTRRVYADCLGYFGARERGDATREQLEAAFRSLARLPRTMVGVCVGWWFLGGLLVAGCMALRFEDFGVFAFVVMLAAATTGGFVSSLFIYFRVKREYRADLESMARALGSFDARRRLVESLPIGRKLVVAVTGVTAVTVLFAWLLAMVRVSGTVEANAVALHERYLDEISQELGRGASASFAELSDRAVRLGIASEFAVFDLETGEQIDGGSSLSSSELEAIRRSPDAGDSRGFDSPHVLTWRAFAGDGEVIVAISPWEGGLGGTTDSRLLFGAALLASLGIAYAASRGLASEIGDSSRELGALVDRVASGDLSDETVFESDDELGELARSFEQMRAALRETVEQFDREADRVETTSVEIGSISQDVSAGAVAQGDALARAVGAMEAVDRQVAEISDSSEELNELVEESSSSILEMSAASDELSDTASVLSAKVDEVSGSIEQMARSAEGVVETTEAVAEAATDTSSSMEEMASAMRQVQATADETALLSQSVVDAAESGRSRVRETIEGMESIRVATDSAEKVVRGLASRAGEIGAIVDVIDDVADETNLLALNAAIIAAQAGDQGRAFSVVAEEIKELADRVLSSTKEIGDLIRAVQQESANAIDAIEEGSRSVAIGVERATDSGVSLEEITRASRDSGLRIEQIVAAVGEQTRAAAHVVGLMERVSGGVEQIRSATHEQQQGNQVVFASTDAMRDVATQVRRTTEEQSRGGARVRDSISRVRELVEGIHQALKVQSGSCREVTTLLEDVSARSRSHDESSQAVIHSTGSLARQAAGLRDRVGRFRL